MAITPPRLIDPLDTVSRRLDEAAGALMPAAIRQADKDAARYSPEIPPEGRVAGGTVLPTPSAYWHQRVYHLHVAAGVDIPYLGISNAAGAHAWLRLGGEAQYVTLRFWINDLPATATTAASYLYFNTVTAVSQGNGDPRLSRGGVVVGALLTSDAACTAGTAIVQVRINGVATAFAAGACVINTTLTVSNTAHVAPAAGLAFTGPANIGAAVVTSGFAPITANVVVELVLRLDPWG